ncbi:hypothetical protein ACFQS1_29920 [Paractinoplanes rhizophilus]|uniref:Uncharacterized protein n=1 Tax=Paractinoplanes rhizophilus TaxID=1416877 RepID=A0ABW2HZJ1_9ACTN
MRGGLDDALDKLARRDELRRRAASEATGTSPAVTELVEAIAGVVARHPELGVTVGAEGSGDPVLLHFFFAEGQVQVNADIPVPPASAAPAPRHADIVDVDLDDPLVEDPYPARPVSPPASPAGEPRRMSHDDQDRYGPAHYGYAEPSARDAYYADSDTAERRYGSFDSPPPADDLRHPARDPGETSRDLGARMRDLGMAARDAASNGPGAGGPVSDPLAGGPIPGGPVSGGPVSSGPVSSGPVSSGPVSSGPVSGGAAPAYPPHPFAATPPPPVPPQSSGPDLQTHRIQADQYRAPAEPAAHERMAPQRGGAMPTPLPKPIPLQVERPEETELAARRLAALLRDDPSLLNNTPRD